jgi:hypothetical protein
MEVDFRQTDGAVKDADPIGSDAEPAGGDGVPPGEHAFLPEPRKAETR